jgi:hypothetical protein
VARAVVMKDGNGNGVFRAMWDGEVLLEDKPLAQCRKESMGKVVLEHTITAFERALERDI